MLRSRLPETFSSHRWLALAAAGVVLFGTVGCSERSSSRSRGPKDSAKAGQESILESVQIAAKNSDPAPPLAPLPPPPKQQITIAMTPPSKPELLRPAKSASPVVISERVTTEIPFPTESEADSRALESAQRVIEAKLKELDPPVDYVPSLAVVKNEYLKRDSRLVRLPTESEKAVLKQAGYDAERKYVEYTVEVTADQVRELRTRNRVADGLRGLGVISAIALAGFLFLRLDEWSKGYLTRLLALGAAALGGGVIAAVVFV
jgi:hypothetical protein